MFGAPKKCAKCDKQVYPIEELKCLDKIWHKNCFKCSVCNSLLNMKNYKGFDKQPYCVVHYPQQKPTVVSDNPELLRIKENTKIQSNAKYHEEFEKSKGSYTVVADDPETRRILENTKIISQVKYHEDFEKNIKNKQQNGNGLETNGNGETIARHMNGNGNGVYQVQQPTLVATFKSGGGERLQSTQLINNGNFALQQQQAYQQQQRKIGSIADYDPLGYEGNGTSDRFVSSSRNVLSTGNLQQNGGMRTPAFNSASNIMSHNNYVTSAAHTNGSYVYHNGSNGNNGNSHYNNNLDYNNIPVQLQQQQPQQQYYQTNDIKTTVYKAIYDYDAKEDDEISFRDGDKFINCEQIDVGWMIGVHEKTGKHGMFPANYAEPVDFF